jgi:hypothetical protein
MKRLATYIGFFVICALVLFDFSSCRKDTITTKSSAKLSFSADSVLFDTVFTTIGSSTRNIRVRNKNNQRIKISNIALQKGNSSQFIMNVDGLKGTSINDVEIAANDSIYIFIQVNVNPTNQNSPLIISDAIVFSVNGNTQEVTLEAWGQDAYYHYPKFALKFRDGSFLPYTLISNNPTVDTTWNNDKPHVVYGWLVIDTYQKLTINAGTRLYFNNRAGLWVYRYGQLKVKGAPGNEVLFTGARREKEYADEPGQWDRIWINEGSTQNEIDYAIIKNGFIGVQAELIGDTLNVPKRLRITNTKIQNMSKWGLYGFAYNIYGGNNIISNCQEQCVNLVLGGNYTFIHNTFANYWNKEDTRKEPVLKINNYSGNQILPLDTCLFANCIVDGILNNGQEIVLDVKTDNLSFLPKYFFTNCVMKTQMDLSDPAHFQDNLKNAYCDFRDPSNYHFEIGNNTKAGPLNGSTAGTYALKFPADIKGSSRNSAPYYAGAYVK